MKKLRRFYLKLQMKAKKKFFKRAEEEALVTIILNLQQIKPHVMHSLEKKG